MAYCDFTLDLASRALGVATRESALFPLAKRVEVPRWLDEALGRRTQLALISEKARSEFIVVPILLAVRELSPGPLAIFSGQRLDVDPPRGLVGECDFILAAAPAVPPLRAPIMTIVEAKKNDIEGGLGRCVAEMIAARLFKERAGLAPATVSGCVTSGEVWQFLRLSVDGETVEIDRDRRYLDDIAGILSVFRAIVGPTAAA